MKRILFLICILNISICCAFGQSIQKGYVLKYNGANAKTPINGALIKASNADEVKTNKKGEFFLKFRTKVEGDKISGVEVYFPGFIVMNKEELSKWTVSSSDPFTIILCDEVDFKARFNKNLDIITYALKKKYEEKGLEINNSFYDQIEKLEVYVDKFTRIDLSEGNEINKNIYDLFIKGRLDEAINLFDEQDILGQYRAQVEDYSTFKQTSNFIGKKMNEVVDKRNNLQQAILNQVNLLRMNGDKENIEKALSISKDFYEADPSNESATLNYADLLYSQLRYDEAANIYYRLLDSKDNETSGTAYFTLGHIIMLSSNFDKCINLITPKLEQLDSICYATEDFSIYLNHRAEAHFILMMCHMYLNNEDEAIRYSDMSIIDYKELSSKKPSLYNSTYVNVLTQSSVMYSRMEKQEKAYETGVAGLELAEKLYNENNNKYRHIAGTAYKQMGNVLSFMEKYDDAELNFSKAESILEIGYKENDELFGSYLAQCYQNHGFMYLSKPELIDKSIRPLEKASKIYENLSPKEPLYYYYPLIITYKNISSYYEQKKNYSQVIHYSSLAEEYIDKLEVVTPNRYSNLLKDTHSKLATAYLQEDKFNEAYEVLQRGLKRNPESETLKYLLDFTKGYINK